MQLIKLAYIEARSSGRESIDITDITRAYRSPVYATNQKDVEELHLQALQNRTTGRRIDLRCPFELPSTLRSNVVKFARADRDNRVINKVFHSSLNESERSAIEHIEPEASKATRSTKLLAELGCPKRRRQIWPTLSNKSLSQWILSSLRSQGNGRGARLCTASGTTSLRAVYRHRLSKKCI